MIRSCRHCGCTDPNACVSTEGVPCHWTSAAECSACTTPNWTGRHGGPPPPWALLHR